MADEQQPDQFEAAIADIKAAVPEALQSPKCAIVCGSGLAGLAALLQDRVDVPYSSISGFPFSTVQGHKSVLAFGTLGPSAVPVVCQLGRFHAYEGHPLSSVILPVKVFARLGCTAVLLTNAAGGLNPSLEVGKLVALKDHISLPSLTSWNPLVGPNDDVGPRFPPMSNAYDYELRKAFFRAAGKLGLLDHTTEGVYAWVAGPTYETRAESLFLRAAGADVVGMSTVPEVIAAHHSGLRVLTLSLVTNMVVSKPQNDAKAAVEAELRGEKAIDGEEETPASHQEVLDAANKRAEDLKAIVTEVIESTFGSA